MFSEFRTIGFCGSRSLSASARPLVTSVVSSVLKESSAQITVGCSIGADELVLSSIPESALSRVSIFAAFGAGGVGACSLSPVPSVINAVRGGASVNWWSDGNENVSVKGRLAFTQSQRSSMQLISLKNSYKRNELSKLDYRKQIHHFINWDV